MSASSLALVLAGLLGFAGCAAPVDEGEVDESAGAASKGDADPALDPRLKDALTDYFKGGSGLHGLRLATVAPADLGRKPDFAVRHYQVGEKNEAFDWKRITIGDGTYGLVHACEYTRFSKSGRTMIYVFDEKGEAEVLTGSTDRHECFREVATSVRWDAAPSKAPQLVY